jgi:SAM-dependent methyltransferase
MDNKITWEEAVLWLIDQPEQQELVRACYFDDPLFEAAQRFETSEEWQAVLKILSTTPGDALDIGAGRGISSYALAKAGWHVTALEPDSSTIVGREAIDALAKQTNLPIYPLDGYAEKIPCEDEQFDLVYGRQVMHHAQNLQTMCNEIVRVLKPGGMFIATREHVISKKADLNFFLANHPLHDLYGGENAYLLIEYLGCLHDAGLHIKRVLGPMETVINYFPTTYRDWKCIIQTPVRNRLGSRITHILFSDMLPWSRFINVFLAKWSDRQNQTPGRLYSFVAFKNSL